jgi:hypothetical protein
MFDAFRVFLPYLIFAAGVWRLANNKPYRQLTLLAFVVPIIWGVFFTLCYILHSYLMDPMVDRNVLWIMAFWATFVAYIVEIIPYLILTIFKGDFKADSWKQLDSSPLDRSVTLPEN